MLFYLRSGGNRICRYQGITSNLEICSEIHLEVYIETYFCFLQWATVAASTQLRSDLFIILSKKNASIPLLLLVMSLVQIKSK